jgi:hypothetical protein
MRRPSAGAINAVPAHVIGYAPDPYGANLFGSLSAVLQRGISGHTGTIATGDRGAPEASFNGDLGRNLQHFTGAAALALYGTAKPAYAQPNDLVHAVSTDTLNDPALQIFAARARRQAIL